MAIKFSQFNLRTDHTEGMYLVGYDGNQNIHITVDNLFDDFINGTENTIAMFGTDGIVLADSILSQDAGATLLTVAGQLNVDADATFDTNITVTGDSTLNGNVTLGDANTDLITQTGTLYLNGPIKDTTDTLGAVDQVLLSDATGELTFTDLADLHVGGAEVVEVPVKNMQGSALVKGDPVYISGSVGASGRLEVQLADASNTLKMPAVGLLKQDLADNAEGFAVVTGKLRNLITDPIDGVNPAENDVIYVKPSGTSGAALTTTKPVYGNFIQNIGKVGRVSTAADGNFVVSSILRTNDIPNLTPGRLWVGSTGNTIESQTIFVDEANAQVAIGTTSPAASVKLHVEGGLRVNGGNLNITNSSLTILYLNTSNSTDNYLIQNSGGNFQVKNNSGLGDIQFQVRNDGQIRLDNYGSQAFTGTAAYNLSVDSSGNIIETDAVPANIVETITTTDGTYINLTPNSATDGAVTITADLSAADGTSDTTTKFLSKDNTWDVPSYTTITTTNGSYIDLTPTSATGGAVTVTADLSATGTPDATKYLRGDNTWATITGVYDWDISDGVNLPDTIANGETVTFAGGTYLTTTYAAATNTLTIDHDDTARVDTASSDSPAFGGTFQAVTSVTTNTTGHLEAINVSTVTLPTPVNYSWAITADTGTSQTVLNGNTVDIAGGTYISTVVGATDTVTVNHDETTRTDTASSDTPGYGGTFTVVDSVTTNVTGHLEAINVKTVTMPSADDTNTTYDLSGYGTSNGTAGVQLVGSDATTDQVAITGAGTTTVAHSGNTITVTSNDQYTGTVDGSGTANYVTKWLDADTITDSVAYDDGTNIGIGTTTPNSKLQVDGAVQVADDTDTASADKVGALRYRTSGNNSYVDMCMQTDASTYAWVNIVQNNW